MEDNEKLQYARINVSEPYGVGVQWDIMEKYQIDEIHGSTKFYQLATPIYIMTKRQIIKRLVAMGGERTRRRGQLEIYFDAETYTEAKEWLDSLMLINRLGNT